MEGNTDVDNGMSGMLGMSGHGRDYDQDSQDESGQVWAVIWRRQGSVLERKPKPIQNV